jgi:hypothetical protein
MELNGLGELSGYANWLALWPLSGKEAHLSESFFLIIFVWVVEQIFSVNVSRPSEAIVCADLHIHRAQQLHSAPSRTKYTWCLEGN